MKFIENLNDGERVAGIYLCKSKALAVTKNGKEYFSLILQDRTGTIDGKIWEPHSMGIDDFEALDYIDINGDVTNFNGTLQISIKRVRKAHEGEYNEGDYLPTTDMDITKLYESLLKCVSMVENPYLHELLEKFFVTDKEFSEKFKKHSAAKSMHHAFIGGLLQHTMAVANLCYYYCKQYPMINRDLLLTAALVHDMGKIWELSEFPVNDYTDEGQLLGHIIIGVEKIGRIADEIEDFPPVLLNELKHCILAHHGELEYGSPKKPALIEALALHFADNTDAKLQAMSEILGKPTSQTGEWTGYQRMFESNVRKTKGI